MASNNPDFRQIAKIYQKKLEKIKLVLFDVDGILTDGKIYWAGEEVGFNRQFHIHDGFGIKMLKRFGLEVGIITGGNSQGVFKRFELLGIDLLYTGSEDKRPAFEDILQKTKLSPQEICYMGDEFFDLPILRQVGFSATVPNASLEVQEAVDYITHRAAGEACAREVMDLIRYAQNLTPDY